MNMRLMRFTLLVAVLSAMTMAQAKDKSRAKDSDDAKQAITQMENELKDAAIQGDSSVSQKYLSRNYVRVYPDGSMADRDQTIADIQSKTKYSSISVSGEQVTVTGNTAVSVFQATVKGTRDGQPIDGDYRGLRTWTKEGGQWKVSAFSTTRIVNK